MASESVSWVGALALEDGAVRTGMVVVGSEAKIGGHRRGQVRIEDWTGAKAT